MRLKMLSGKRRPFCLGLNVFLILTYNKPGPWGQFRSLNIDLLPSGPEIKPRSALIHSWKPTTLLKIVVSPWLIYLIEVMIEKYNLEWRLLIKLSLWRHTHGSTFLRIMACYHTATSHYLKQCCPYHKWRPVALSCGWFSRKCSKYHSLKCLECIDWKLLLHLWKFHQISINLFCYSWHLHIVETGIAFVHTCPYDIREHWVKPW